MPEDFSRIEEGNRLDGKPGETVLTDGLASPRIVWAAGVLLKVIDNISPFYENTRL